MVEHLRGNVTDIIGRFLFTIYDFDYHSVDYVNLASNLYPVVLEYCVAVLAALLPIYTGSWASLKRPSSARKLPEQEEDEYEPEDEFEALGFVPLDIIRVPLFAGAALTGMYYLIKYLDDPDLISKVLSAYFAFAGLYSVTFFVSDTLRAAHKLTFPSYYARGLGNVWFVDGETRTATQVLREDSAPEGTPKDTPLPGLLSTVKLPAWGKRFLWNVRKLPLQKFLFKFSVHRVVADKTVLDAIDLIGIISALGVIAAYLWFSRPWYLTNLLGISFSYFAVQQMSPTSFKLASAVMTGLLIYDVVMVFYTPMMVTVATKLDIPAKLTFPRPSKTPGKAEFSILGLGDIVLPGIVIALALRFDLHMAYSRMQNRSPKDDSLDESDETLEASQAYYVPHHTHWHNLWWTRKAAPRGSRTLKAFSRFDFPTPYFTAAMLSYPLAMIVCWVAMSISRHGQPALFYLVPSLLLAIWLTAWRRGEIKEAWAFHEEMAEDVKDEKEKTTDKDSANVSETITNANGKTEPKASPQPPRRSLRNSTKESSEATPTLDSTAASPQSDEKLGDNVVRLENKLKQSADLDLVYFGISTKSPNPEKPMSSLLHEDAVLEAYGLTSGLVSSAPDGSDSKKGADEDQEQNSSVSKMEKGHAKKRLRTA
jgi:minor histocompatibility antigen H13